MFRVFLLVIILQITTFSAYSANEPVKDLNNVDKPKLDVSQYKPLADLKATVCDNKVKLTFSKAKRYYGKSEYDNLYKNIFIYRKQVGFVFGTNHKNFFDGLKYSAKDLIYSGYIKPENNRSFTYYDETASVGKTYAYWVGVEGGKATGPYPVKVRDPNIWWSQNKISQELYNLQKTYPDMVKVSVIGRTAKGRDLLGVVVDKSNKKLALVGAVHASESGPELIIPAIKTLHRLYRKQNQPVCDR